MRRKKKNKKPQMIYVTIHPPPPLAPWKITNIEMLSINRAPMIVDCITGAEALNTKKKITPVRVVMEFTGTEVLDLGSRNALRPKSR